MEWFSSLPTRLIAVLLFNAVLATVLALCFGLILYRRLKEDVYKRQDKDSRWFMENPSFSKMVS